jgi:hypothetical protein
MLNIIKNVLALILWGFILIALIIFRSLPSKDYRIIAILASICVVMNCLINLLEKIFLK